jgi:hypothetical protein
MWLMGTTLKNDSYIRKATTVILSCQTVALMWYQLGATLSNNTSTGLLLRAEIQNQMDNWI